MTTLPTPRCTLRPLAAAHADDLHELWTAPGVRLHLWDNEIIPFARTADAIAQSERLFADHDFGLWGAWVKDSPRLCGFGGLWPFRDPPDLELLYGVAEDLWGHGYATEIAQAIATHCLHHLGMPRVRASEEPSLRREVVRLWQAPHDPSPTRPARWSRSGSRQNPSDSTSNARLKRAR